MFDKIIGNEEIQELLKQTIKSKRASHSYLFIGTEGIGKKQIAKEFAKEGYIICLEDFSSLGDIIKDMDKFKPKKYKSNNDNFVKLVEDFIDKN